MLQEESDLSLIIAQIVQKLKGSNLYSQLERQAWVSEAEWEEVGTGRAAGDASVSSGTPLAQARARLWLSRPAPVHGAPSFQVHLLSLARGVTDF